MTIVFLLILLAASIPAPEAVSPPRAVAPSAAPDSAALGGSLFTGFS